jgi:hypothetical protein
MNGISAELKKVLDIKAKLIFQRHKHEQYCILTSSVNRFVGLINNLIDFLTN